MHLAEEVEVHVLLLLFLHRGGSRRRRRRRAAAAEANADGSARKSFSFWISGNVKSISEQSEARFLSEFATMCGSDASVRMPISRLKAAMFFIEAQNCVITISSVMSSTALSNTAPLSYTETTFIPYSNGLIPIFVSSTAWEAVIFLSFWHTVCSVVSSIVPFTILVGILSVWKKFVCDGSRPVGPAGSFTSIGAITPALAPAGTLFSVTVLRISSMS